MDPDVGRRRPPLNDDLGRTLARSSGGGPAGELYVSRYKKTRDKRRFWRSFSTYFQSDALNVELKISQKIFSRVSLLTRLLVE
jgi:hypothetical protein